MPDRSARTVALLVFALIAAWESPTLACSCITDGDESPARNELKNYEAVFLGQVVADRLTDGELPREKDGARVALDREITFEVHEVWKGEIARSVSIYTGFSEASCGYPFKLGSVYLVWAGGEPKELSVGLCERTKPISDAHKDLEHLGKPEREHKW